MAMHMRQGGGRRMKINWTCCCGSNGTGSPFSHMKDCELPYFGADAPYGRIEFWIDAE